MATILRAIGVLEMFGGALFVLLIGLGGVGVVTSPNPAWQKYNSPAGWAAFTIAIAIGGLSVGAGYSLLRGPKRRTLWLQIFPGLVVAVMIWVRLTMNL